MPRRSWSVAWALALILASAAPAQPPIFLPQESPVPFGTLGASAAGDVEGDGDDDLLFAGSGVYLNDGHGLFTPHPTWSPATGTIPAPGPGLDGLLLSDLTGDGAADAVLWATVYSGVTATATIQVWLNQGSGVFYPSPWPLPFSLPLAGEVNAVRAGDIDGDGDQDLFIPRRLLCGNHGQYSCPVIQILLLNTGNGLFVDASTQFAGGAAAVAHNAAFADLDLDGDQDVVSIQAGVTVSWLVNTGTGVFTPGSIPPHPTPFQTLLIGDPAGIGRPSVLYASWPTMQLLTLTAAGSWTVTDALVQDPGWSYSHLLDCDGDGRDDLVHFVTDGIGVRRWLGSGGFGPVTATGPISLGGAGLNCLALIDADDDGDRDLALNRRDRADLFLNNGSGALIPTSAQIPFPNALRTVAIDDVDGDGDQDQVQIVNTNLRLAVNDGRGNLARLGPAGPTGVTSATTLPVVLFDKDGDGDQDAYAGTFAPYGEREAMFRFDPATGWTAWATFLNVTTYLSAAVAGDLDGDLAEDLVIASGSNSNSAWPQGNGNFFRRNIGGSGFAPAIPLPGGPQATRDLALADLDQDGDRDLIEANGSGFPLAGASRVLLNAGTGTFVPTAFVGPPAASVTTGDLDGDGDIDMLLDCAIFLNTGSGNFGPAGTISSAACPVADAVLLDADLDGDLDAILLGTTVVLHRNNGAGGFAAAEILGGAVPGVQCLHAGDIDRDGDSDIFVEGIGGPYQLINRTRHLALAGLPLIGHPIRFDVFGPPGTTAGLFASAVPALIPAPPSGFLFLDLPSTILIDSGPMPAASFRRSTFALPASPALAGIPFHVQAWIDGAARLTNVLDLRLFDG